MILDVRLGITGIHGVIVAVGVAVHGDEVKEKSRGTCGAEEGSLSMQALMLGQSVSPTGTWLAIHTHPPFALS